MRLVSIYIRNFKSIKELGIKFNEEFNLIIGKNNIGKTTIFEALMLWKKCYDLNIQSKKKSFYAKAKNISFSDVKSLRIYEDDDLFNKIERVKTSIEVSVQIEDCDSNYNLGFIITNLIQEKKTYLQVKYKDENEFVKFSKLTSKYQKTLIDLIVISRSKPVANIPRKEPYMYKDQVIGKIAKGRGTEVLRNKFVALTKDSRAIVEENISNVMGYRIKFIEDGNGKKEYIKLKVETDGKKVDILSQGSGFLQLVEIFTSMEYKKGILNIFLIDEPDAHLHAELQLKLVETIRSKVGNQTFIISHNDRFLTNTNDENIIFINKDDKKKGIIEPLKRGGKLLVLENLVDNVSEIENIRYINKLVLVEGKTDVSYIKRLYGIYKDKGIVKANNINIKFQDLRGIDKINTKLSVLSNTYKETMSNNVEWIILKDRDLIPSNRLKRAENEINEQIIGFTNKKVLFQQGYELYSTLFSEEEKLVDLLSIHYGIEKNSTEYESFKDGIRKYLDCYTKNIFNAVEELHEKMKKTLKGKKKIEKEKYMIV